MSERYTLRWRPAPEATDGEPWFGRSDYTFASMEAVPDFLELAVGEQDLAPGALLRVEPAPKGGALWVLVDDLGDARASKPRRVAWNAVSRWESPQAEADYMVDRAFKAGLRQPVALALAAATERALVVDFGKASKRPVERARALASALREEGLPTDGVNAERSPKGVREALAALNATNEIGLRRSEEALRALALYVANPSLDRVLTCIVEAARAVDPEEGRVPYADPSARRLARFVRREVPLGMLLLAEARIPF